MENNEFVSELKKPNLQNCTKQELVEYYEDLKKEHAEYAKECKIQALKEFMRGDYPEINEILTTKQYIKLVVKKYDKEHAKFVRKADKALNYDLEVISKLKKINAVEEEHEI